MFESAWVGQAGLLVGETLAVAAFILYLFRLRSDFGLSLLYVVLGGFQYIQALLILSVYVEILPHFLISPGSAIMFTATLFAVLLVYLKEDGVEAKKLIYGIALANLALSVLTIVTAKHVASHLVRNLYGLPGDMFIQVPRILVLSTLVLILAVLCVLAVYRALGRWLRNYVLLRIFLSMLAALTVESILFTTACFFTHPDYRAIIFSGLMSKAVVAAFYAALLTAYMSLTDQARLDAPIWRQRLSEILSVARYRNKYEALKREYVRDPLTRVFSRGYFDDAMQREVARAQRLNDSISIVMLDLDNFKDVNDTHGHIEGDRVLRATGDVLSSTVRNIDLPCRYGGDEFAIILPGATDADAHQLAKRLRNAFAERSKPSHADPLASALTITIAYASLPKDTNRADELLAIADARLYEGKRAGRNRIVTPN